jgi:hypothetical protein
VAVDRRNYFKAVILEMGLCGSQEKSYNFMDVPKILPSVMEYYLDLLLYFLVYLPWPDPVLVLPHKPLKGCPHLLFFYPG